MTHARISGTTIIDVMEQPPQQPLVLDGRSWDFRVPSVRDEWLALNGWLPVAETPRPADSLDGVWERSIVVSPDSGAPVFQWVLRPWTDGERSARATEAVRSELSATATADNQKVLDSISGLATLLGDAATPGSYRQWKNQPNATITSAAGLKALVDLLIGHARADRRIARQVLRLSKLTTGDLATSDVGPE